MAPSKLSPPEVILLADPRASAGVCLQAALLALISRGLLTMRTEGKWFKRSYLCLQPGEIAALPRHLGTVWYALEPHAHGGQIDTSQTAKALRQAFGSDLRGYVGNVLAPPLVQAGLLRQKQRRFLGLIPYQSLERTPAGEARVRPMLRLLEEAKGIRKLLRDDPDRALSLAQAAGIMLVLSPQARAAIPKLKQLLADHSGGDAHVSSDSGWNDEGEPGWDASLEVGSFSAVADLNSSLSDIGAIAGFTDGDGGGGDGDGGGGGD